MSPPPSTYSFITNSHIFHHKHLHHPPITDSSHTLLSHKVSLITHFAIICFHFYTLHYHILHHHTPHCHKPPPFHLHYHLSTHTTTSTRYSSCLSELHRGYFQHRTSLLHSAIAHTLKLLTGKHTLDYCTLVCLPMFHPLFIVRCFCFFYFLFVFCCLFFIVYSILFIVRHYLFGVVLIIRPLLIVHVVLYKIYLIFILFQLKASAFDTATHH